MHGEAGQAVRCDGAAVTAVGGGDAILGALAGEETFASHEPGNAVAPAGTTQGMRQARAAVGLPTARKLLPDARAQMDVLECARPGLATALLPVVITTARNQERFT